MSASGQMPSDYGQHWTHEAYWADYGPCGCGAGPGRAGRASTAGSSTCRRARCGRRILTASASRE